MGVDIAIVNSFINQPFWWHCEISACQLTNTRPFSTSTPAQRYTFRTREGKCLDVALLLASPWKSHNTRLNKQTTLCGTRFSSAQPSTFHPFPPIHQQTSPFSVRWPIQFCHRHTRTVPNPLAIFSVYNRQPSAALPTARHPLENSLKAFPNENNDVEIQSLSCCFMLLWISYYLYSPLSFVLSPHPSSWRTKLAYLFFSFRGTSEKTSDEIVGVE